jgi:type II restriction enzyme
MNARRQSLTLLCDTSVADSYKSESQRSRVISEAWFLSFGYCLSCNNDKLHPTVANTRANDFLCPDCDQGYELKTFGVKPSRTLVDGAYSAMMTRILGGKPPTLMLLERSHDWTIKSLTAVHGKFLTPEVIVRRKPLSPEARRAGWVGCNIRLDLIAPDAQIPVIADGQCGERGAVRTVFQRFDRLGSLDISVRGWATLTLRIVRSLGTHEFSLDSIYGREGEFAAIYPNNRNIRAKIRQQLQVLRDLGFIEFCGKGSYRVLI